MHYLIALFLICALTGCGQSGPLYLPSQDNLSTHDEPDFPIE